MTDDTKSPALKAIELQTEGRTDPIGLGERRPHLSWMLTGPGRDREQRAYRILVARDADPQDPGAPIVWDSGTVAAPDSVEVPYAGPSLLARTRYCWRVQVWDEQDRPSEWSAPATWEMGLLEPADWSAVWIGPAASDTTPTVSLETARPSAALSRIWVDDVPPVGGTARLRSRFEVPRGARILGAAVTVGGAGTVQAYLNGRAVPATGDVSGAVRSGPNVLAVAVDAEDADPTGIVARLEVWLEGHRPVCLDTDDPWRAVTSAPEGWQAPEFDDAAWPRAEAVAAHGEPPRGREPGSFRPSPYLRRELSVGANVRRARVHATALGLYELRINGRRVGEDHLAPGWTDYAIRVPYQTYDVTNLLHEGENAIGAILADGWYAGNVCWFGQFQYGRDLALRAQVEIEYADGRRETIGTDRSWQVGEGGLRYADLQNGVVDDARLEPHGWDTVGFDAAGFAPVAVQEPAHGPVEAAVAPAVRVQQELEPVSVTRRPDGRILLDFGQNLVGWARLRLRGRPGQRILLRHAEALQADGELYTINLRSATATDEYILRGDPDGETFEPRFTVHGFRYLEIHGYDGDLQATARVAYAAMEPIGEFHCSDPALEKLQQNIVWGQRGNFLSVPTDCPQRDERLGWTGDAQVFASTAAFNYDVRNFFRKWITDLVDAQRPNGAIPHVAPDVLTPGAALRASGPPPEEAGAAGWGDAIAIIPWQLHRIYGDERIVGQAYAAVSRWIAYLQVHSDGLVRPNHGFGDWLAIASTPTDLVSTAFFAYAARIASDLAGILDFPDDAKRYLALSEQVRAAFRERYVLGGGRVASGSQTAYVLALHCGLLEEHEIPRAVQHLIAEVSSRNWHLTTGFLGTPYLLSVLSDNGALDAAYTLLLQDTFPSWLYPVVHGDATTIWERWDSWSDSRGFQDPGMTSFNHYAYGAVGDWIYRNVGGIEPLEPGYRRTRIRPRPGGGLTSGSASFRSPHGPVASSWSIAGGILTLEATVPVNTRAEIHVPAGDPAAVRGDGVEPARLENGAAVFEVGSGTYRFDAPTP